VGAAVTAVDRADALGFFGDAVPCPSASAAVRFERDLSAARDAEEAAVRMKRVVERMKERVEELRAELKDIQGADEDDNQDDAVDEEETARTESEEAQADTLEGGDGSTTSSPAKKKKKKIGRGSKCDPNSVTREMVERMLDRPWTVRDKSGPDKRGHSFRYKNGGVFCAACEKAVSFYLVSQHIIGPRHLRALEGYKKRTAGVGAFGEGQTWGNTEADAKKMDMDAAAIEAESRATDLLRRLRVAQTALLDAERTLAGTERVAETFRHSAEAARGEMGAEAESMKRAAQLAKAEAEALKAKLAEQEKDAEARRVAKPAVKRSRKRKSEVLQQQRQKKQQEQQEQLNGGEEGIVGAAGTEGNNFADDSFHAPGEEGDQLGGEPSTPNSSRKGRGAKREPGYITQEMVDNIIAKPWRKGSLSGPDKTGHSLTYYNNGLYCRACRKEVSFYLATQHIIGRKHVKMLEEYKLGGGPL